MNSVHHLRSIHINLSNGMQLIDAFNRAKIPMNEQEGVLEALKDAINKKGIYALNLAQALTWPARCRVDNDTVKVTVERAIELIQRRCAQG